MNSFRAWIAIALLSACADPVLAADISISSESLSVSDDDVTTYVGDVTVVVPPGMALKIEAAARSSTASTETLSGDVRFTVGTLQLTTKKAVLTRKANGEIEIKMDTAASREIPAK